MILPSRDLADPRISRTATTSGRQIAGTAGCHLSVRILEFRVAIELDLRAWQLRTTTGYICDAKNKRGNVT
ncbi:hypothetical protein BaRGS_00001546 [Batillaria attramentaria]|uniref:Uncharacterized protein n=1 Tax=Batillaria attramentaria TaxID=370345 RepID=A0ABD0M842_9CAEN